MKKHSRTLIGLIAFLTLPLMAGAQGGPVFSQPFSAPLRTNPSLMAANPDIHVGLGYRMKWSSFSDGYQTPRLTFMMPVMVNEGSKLDVGLSVLNDQAGAFSRINAMLAVGYDLMLADDHHLSLSLTGGYAQNSLSRGDLTFDEQYVDGEYNASNPHNEAVLNERTSYADIGFGLLWYFNGTAGSDTSNLQPFAGISGQHMNAPNATYIEGNGSLPRIYNTIVGVRYTTSGPFSFTPNLRVHSQSSSSAIASGLYAGYAIDDGKRAQLGVWYKENGAFAASLGAEISGFRFAYSYDIPTNTVRTRISGIQTHEISLSYRIDQGHDRGASPFPIF
jgi:type IX secretion system PorP/SprF family membrane protein